MTCSAGYSQTVGKGGGGGEEKGGDGEEKYKSKRDKVQNVRKDKEMGGRGTNIEEAFKLTSLKPGLQS